ncbi:unnamed protein product, partial [Strongylus vulgaris]
VDFSTRNKTPADVFYDSEIGPVVSHLYQVSNRGPSEIDSATLDIFWPSFSAEGGHLLYMITDPVISDPSKGRCRVKQVQNINPLNLRVTNEHLATETDHRMHGPDYRGEGEEGEGEEGEEEEEEDEEEGEEEEEEREHAVQSHVIRTQAARPQTVGRGRVGHQPHVEVTHLEGYTAAGDQTQEEASARGYGSARTQTHGRSGTFGTETATENGRRSHQAHVILAHGGNPDIEKTRLGQGHVVTSHGATSAGGRSHQTKVVTTHGGAQGHVVTSHSGAASGGGRSQQTHIVTSHGGAPGSGRTLQTERRVVTGHTVTTPGDGRSQQTHIVTSHGGAPTSGRTLQTERRVVTSHTGTTPSDAR